VSSFPPALRHADYRRYLFGAFVSNVGNMLQSAAIALHIYQLTFDANNPSRASYFVGLVGLVRVLPLLVFSLYGGIVADHNDRRKVVIVTQCCMSAIALLLTAMEYFNFVSLWMIYAAVALLSITNSFDNPARQAMVPNLVPVRDLPNALALNGISWRLSDVVGPIFAGVIVLTGGLSRFGGYGTCYLLNFATFIAVIVAVWKLPALPPQGQDSGRPQNIPAILSAIKDGLRFVNRTPVLRSSLWIDFWATLFSAADALLPAFGTTIFAAGPAGFGLLSASAGIGALTGALLMTWLPTVRHQGRWVILMIGLYGLSTVLFGFAPNLWLGMIFLAATGFADMVSTVLRQTIRQLTTPDRMRGRMTATSVLFHATGPQLGDYEAGSLALAVGERWSVAIGGFASLLLAGWWGRGGALKSYEHMDEESEAKALSVKPRLER
jgi:MFS family permease